MNEWYLRDLSRKVRSAAQQRGKAGKTLTTNPCFGYVKDPNDKTHLLIDPEAAETIRRIYKLAAAGKSQLSICRTLAKEQRATPGCYRAQWNPMAFADSFPRRIHIGGISE